MKFLIDANLPYSLKLLLSKIGKTMHVRDIGLQAAPDKIIFKAAIKHKATLISRDLEFGNPYVYPQGSHYGIIILRVPFRFNTEQITQLMQSSLDTINGYKLQKTIVVIEPGKIRVRMYNPAQRAVSVKRGRRKS